MASASSLAGEAAAAATATTVRQSQLLSSVTTALVIGAGVAIGVSGLYVFFRKQNREHQQQLANLTRTIEGLRKDIGELKVVASGNGISAAPVTCRPMSVDAERVATRSALVCRSAAASATGQTHPSPCVVSSSTTTLQSNCSDDNEGDIYFDVSDHDDEDGEHDLIGGATPIIQDTVSDRLQADGTMKTTMNGRPAGSIIDFAEIDDLLAGDAVDNELAYGKLMSQKDQGMSNPEFVWRLARACYLGCMSASRSGDVERQKSLIADGIACATAGLAIDGDHPDLHKWYAVILGKSTDFLGVKDKIENGFKFKEHLDRAIALRPDDRALYFMKGRWCYEVARLTWMERKVAATLFATPPTSTLAEARQQFLTVERLFPLKWKENLLCIAKCLIGEQNYSEAVTWLKKAASLECKSQEEEVVHREVQQLLSKYQKYDA